MLEISPEAARGGNSAFTGGAWRIVYRGFDDLARLIPDISDHELANVDVGTYTAEQYYDDIGRLTEYRSDPDLTEILITNSFDTGVWMREKGVRFQLRPRPPGLSGRRQIQVLGRPCVPHLGRRQGVDQGAWRPGGARADRAPLRDAGRGAAARRPRRRRCARAAPGPARRSAREIGRARFGRVRGQRRSAGALSRPGTGISPRCAARASTPGRVSGWHSISAPRRPVIGRARTPAPGT